MPPSRASQLQGEAILFVTGRLAAPSLRETVLPLADKLGFRADIFTAKISVAALMTVDWLLGKLKPPDGITRIVLPGWCQGDTEKLQQVLGNIPVERGPKDLRDLPSYLGEEATERRLDSYDIEILAEINHADQLDVAAVIARAECYRDDGADIIDLGCTPGRPWREVGTVVRELRSRGMRVSIDSFDPDEVSAATKAGAELVLSVNQTNIDRAADWGAEVVVIPERHQEADWPAQLQRSAEQLEREGVRYRLDPILDPIGFGFAAALGRYLEARQRFPDAPILMGIGNLTELTEVDSAGVNTVLLGFCQEISIRSVLTTEVINWSRSSVRELDIARRLAHYAVNEKRIPKHVDSSLVMLRDPRLSPLGKAQLSELHRAIRDPNFRIFAEEGQIHVMNNKRHVTGTDPFEIFSQLGVDEPSHAFYLGWELMKAHTSLQLGKQYTQDQALRWGFLTREEASFHERQKNRDRYDP